MKLPAYGGRACPCSAHRPASRAPASSSMLGGIPPPKACVTLGTCSTAPTSGDASSPCSWTIRSGRQRVARGSRSAAIGGVSVSPNRRGYMKAARSCGLTEATRACRLPTRSRSSGPARPDGAARETSSLEPVSGVRARRPQDVVPGCQERSRERVHREHVAVPERRGEQHAHDGSLSRPPRRGGRSRTTRSPRARGAGPAGPRTRAPAVARRRGGPRARRRRAGRRWRGSPGPRR